jgi:hypothetical protein
MGATGAAYMLLRYQGVGIASVQGVSGSVQAVSIYLIAFAVARILFAGHGAGQLKLSVGAKIAVAGASALLLVLATQAFSAHIWENLVVHSRDGVDGNHYTYWTQEDARAGR